MSEQIRTIGIAGAALVACLGAGAIAGYAEYATHPSGVAASDSAVEACLPALKGITAPVLKPYDQVSPVCRTQLRPLDHNGNPLPPVGLDGTIASSNVFLKLVSPAEFSADHRAEKQSDRHQDPMVAIGTGLSVVFASTGLLVVRKNRRAWRRELRRPPSS